MDSLETAFENYQHAKLAAKQRDVIEECAGLTQALCKADRFGWFNRPDTPNRTNMDAVKAGLDGVIEAIEKFDAELRMMRYEEQRGG